MIAANSSAATEKKRQANRLRAQGRVLEAAEAYAQIAKMHPSSDAGLFAAYALRDAGKLDLARKAFETYASEHPDDYRGWVGLGTFCKQNGYYAEAIEPIRRALALRDEIPTRNSYIASLWRTGAHDAAREEGLKNLKAKHKLALERFSSSPFKSYNLADGGRGFDPERRRRNIISFSLWGNRPEYVTGAIINAQIAQHLYVHWTARFYCDTSVPHDAREALKTYGAEVILMTEQRHAKIRPMWRFLASDDQDINVFLCRDADSRLNAKELLAVQDWLSSGKRFHVMRDHIYHHELILAGMWGGMSGVLPNLESWLLNATDYFDSKFGDQAFLADMIWPLIRQDVRIHDTEYRFPDGTSFPLGYDLPGMIHVGGAVKKMPHWSTYVQMPKPGSD
ncbi:tetratricopeptide repeat protein [Roseovarius sp. MS2]|uniref:tetratricopeptide repeat protein n=1 Tax=Roseovarius TaxID=74030 RepID=UPI003EDBC689